MPTKPWYLSKTVWFNVLGILLAAAGELSSAFPSGAVARVSAFVLTIGNIILRLLTKTTITTTPE